MTRQDEIRTYKDMSVEPGWARHYQNVWEARGPTRTVPLWARIAFLAFGHHKRNGHANFQRGQLALLMGRPGSGGFEPEDKANIRRAIRAPLRTVG
jgi:hypothetical protein